MISVIIPLYNKEHTIGHTLQTVFDQTYKDFEVLIVDDGSTDDSVTIVSQRFSDPRIRLIRQANRGASAARNRGVRESRSEWVSFLDADDEWHPQFLETIVGLIHKYPSVNMVGTGGFNKNMKTGHFTINLIGKYTNQDLLLNYFINPDKMPHVGATAIRKSVFFEVGGFPEGIWRSEDVCLLDKIGLTSPIAYCGRPFHVYVGGVEGQVTSISDSRNKEKRECEGFVYSEVYKMYLQAVNADKLPPIFIKYKLRCFYDIYLRSSDYVSIYSLNESISNDLKRLLGSWFFQVNTIKLLRRILIFYILLTKLIWRLHRFPVVGEVINPSPEFVEMYNQIRK